MEKKDIVSPNYIKDNLEKNIIIIDYFDINN